MNNLEELKKAALKATQGEWWQDVVETEGTYGVGDDCFEGFHSYAVYGPDNRSLLDMTNSTAAIIHTNDDGDYLMAWDETGRRNAEYIALANPAAILDLIAQLEAAQKELSAANEKLSKAVVLPRMHVGFDGVSTNTGDSVRNKAISDCAEAIKAAGITADEGKDLWLM